jgi:hypothetical protein
MPATSDFERAIEKATGESIDSLREMPIAERRHFVERRRGRRLRILPHWPFIGRGSVMHGDTATAEDVDASLDEAVR